MIISNINGGIKFRNTKLQESEDGLTNVITTVLIIAIIMTFIIGPYLTIVVPQQIKRNESDHLDDVEESFIDLRGAINSEVNEDFSSMTTRIKLGTDDENLFVLGGTGRLYLDPSEMKISISSYYDDKSIFARGSGNIRYSSRNLYFQDKNLIYESGGVIVSQRGNSQMDIKPDFQLVRRRVINSIGLDADFGRLAGSDTELRNLFLSNTGSSSVIFNKARITWEGIGNATTLKALNIAGIPVEWSGTAPSGSMITFQNNYVLSHEIVTMRLVFDFDIRDTSVTIELFTTDGQSFSDSWPVIDIDIAAHTYETSFPDFQTVENIQFKNVCKRTVTIDKMALSWTGGATLMKVEIPGYGDEVWNTSFPGWPSPLAISLQNKSIFNPGESGGVTLYFSGNILDEEINLKFFAENASNTITTKYPVDLNETFINGSFSIITLICDDLNVGGKSSKIIKTNLVSSEKNKYIWESGENIVINITTTYGDAWIEYLNKTLTIGANLIWDFDSTGAFQGDYYMTTTQITDELTNIKLILNSIYKLECVIGIVEVELN